MSFYAALKVYTEQLIQAVEAADVETITKVCRDGTQLVRDNTPLTEKDVKVVSQFTEAHTLAESTVKQVRDKLSLDVGKATNARKGIKRYKGVSGNV